MTSCQRCFGRAQLFGCNTCAGELREMLHGLAHGQRLPTGQISAGWIENLQDKVHGLTREGESARRSTERNAPLMVHMLASSLLDNVHAVLVRWVQDICDSRGIDYPRLRFYPRDFIGPIPEDCYRGHADNTTRSAAIWLKHHVNAIACDESFGMCYAEIKQVVDEIERAINRPDNVIDYGPCPTPGEDEQPCAVGLRAKQGDAEVTCWKCKQTHKAQVLITEALSACSRWLFSEYELLNIMGQIGEHIPRGTWWNWRQRGLIESRSEWDAEPKYWLEDARALWGARVGKSKAERFKAAV